MLRGIPAFMPPELVKILMEMGHGDEIVIADRNFPGYTMGKRVVFCGGVDCTQVLRAVTGLMPIDMVADENVFLMAVPPEVNFVPTVWEKYDAVLAASEGEAHVTKLPRFDFYDRAKNAFAVVMTGETERYANIIVKKGVFLDD